MKKVVSIIILVVGVLALTGGIFVLVQNMNADKKAQEEKEEKIATKYDAFKAKLEGFSTQREAMYAKINEVKYLTDLPSKMKGITDEIVKLEAVIKDIDDSSKDLKKDALNETVLKKETQNKIDAFVINYEQIFNLYIEDMKSLNEKVKTYNKYVSDNPLANLKKMEEYKPVYTDYVDVNGDGIFNGKTEVLDDSQTQTEPETNKDKKEA